MSIRAIAWDVDGTLVDSEPLHHRALLAGSRDTILTEFYERALADQPVGVRRVIEDELLTDSGYRESLAEERVIKALAAAGAAPDATAADAAPTAAASAATAAAEIDPDGAADLARQMLAYSGKGAFVATFVDLSELVEENAHLLRAEQGELARVGERHSNNSRTARRSRRVFRALATCRGTS